MAKMALSWGQEGELSRPSNFSCSLLEQITDGGLESL